LRVVDDKCQALFDNCFKLIDGPDAPDLTFQELDRQIIVYISNDKMSNNYKERYQELDPQIKAVKPDSIPLDEWDSYYHFEGYQIFQLKNAEVTLSESRYDPDKVRLVAQFDIKNGIGKLVNYKFDRAIGANVPVVEVDGNDGGIAHSFTIYDDQFSTGDSRLVNHKQYYFSAIAYGYNNYKDYDPTLPTQLDGQKKPYLSGRKAASGDEIPKYTVIPHMIINGTIMNSEYGDGPQITRLEGQGNGNMILELAEETIEEILDKPPAKIIYKDTTASGDTIWGDNYGEEDYPISYNPVYKYGNGPVNIKVIDPLNVKAANYILKFDTAFFDYKFTDAVGNEGLVLDSISIRSTRSWVLTDENTGNKYYSDTSTNYNNEQLFPELGLSVTFEPIFEPGSYQIGELAGFPFYHNFADNNGLLESTVEYADSSVRWLSGVSDNDVPASPQNWIRSGTYVDLFNAIFNDWDVVDGSSSDPWDPNAAYEKIASGTWAPYAMCSADDQDIFGAGPAHSILSKEPINNLRDIASVDIVFTSDKSKWSRCPVVEMCADETLSEGGAQKFGLRLSPSLNKDGVKSGWPADSTISDNPDHPNYIFPHGMSWFPGYAINLETGERLNIMFGEDSWLVGENGSDMLFNPTSPLFGYPSGEPLFGGKHYVYIMQHNTYTIDIGATFTRNFPAYDAGSLLANTIEYDTVPIANRLFTRACAFASTMYVGIPLSDPDKEWLDNDVRVRIRIGKPYDRFYSQPLDSVYLDSPNQHYPMYKFSTEGIATTFDNTDKVESDLDLINVVPNPYYAYSDYERNPLDNRVKLTNLPEKCSVTIYNSNGTLIRQYTKDDPITFLDWDLKNHAGVPIAGGVYIIHVRNEGPGGGERIIKWFGSLRVEDFNQF
ncbi:MAG: T9SS type A sorting domain-containing protein, partial [Bacteroidales bacterium]|nr:T9SS type A sorting domain-containing protein [Bacteroidales bacterium]